LAKSRGADAVFDYHDSECSHNIREYSNGSLDYVLDCISTESSYKLIADAIPETRNRPTQVVTLLPADTWPRKDITPTVILAYTTFGKAFTKFGLEFPPIASHFDFGVMFWKLSHELLEAGRLRPHPVALREGGLSAIPDG
jgi:NADPH:quinone reductase-like Zn-dependent oxidoreductase